jgi:hypothetical protein
MKMIGNFCPEGPGGKHCTCCGQAPGKRKVKQRAMKRRERQQWKREVFA